MVEDDVSRGERLQGALVRAVLEETLAHHTPDTLRELMRRGVLKASPEAAKLEHEQREVRDTVDV